MIIEKFIVTPEMLDFANHFASRFRNLSEGVYKSDPGNYRIDFIKIENQGTWARVSHTREVIEVNRPLVLDNVAFTENFCFYMVIWCWARLTVLSEEEADLLALEYYKTQTDRPVKEILSGLKKQFETSLTTQNIYRMQTLIEKM